MKQTLVLLCGPIRLENVKEFFKLIHICQSYFTLSTVLWHQFTVDGTKIGGIFESENFTA